MSETKKVRRVRRKGLGKTKRNGQLSALQSTFRAPNGNTMTVGGQVDGCLVIQTHGAVQVPLKQFMQMVERLQNWGKPDGQE